MHTITAHVSMSLPRLSSTRRRSLNPGESLTISDSDAAQLRGMFAIRALAKRGEVSIVAGPPDTLGGAVEAGGAVQDGAAVQAAESAVDHVDPVSRLVAAVLATEALAASLTPDQLEQVESQLREVRRARDEAQGPVDEPAPAEDGGEAAPPSDPWALDTLNREQLRDLARQLGLDARVDLRLGEERLREQLRAVIAAEG